MGMSQNSGAPRPYIMNETCRVWGTPILSIPMYGHNPYESTSVMKWQRVLNTAQLFFSWQISPRILVLIPVCGNKQHAIFMS